MWSSGGSGVGWARQWASADWGQQSVVVVSVDGWIVIVKGLEVEVVTYYHVCCCNVYPRFLSSQNHSLAPWLHPLASRAAELLGLPCRPEL